MKRVLRMLTSLLLIFVGLSIVACNVRLYGPGPGHKQFEHVDETLNDWELRLGNGVASDMQRLFPEGYYFSWVLYGLARANLAHEGVEPEHQLMEAWRAYAVLDGAEAKGVFSAELTPSYGIFYQGWRNYLLATILLAEASPTPYELALFSRESDAIAAALLASDTPFLAAYPDQVWPVDTLPAVASLRAHGLLVDDRYDALIDTWLDEIDLYRDAETGLLPHRFRPNIEGTRATSQALIARFMTEIDAERGASDYAAFRSQFLVQRAGFFGMKEYPIGVNGGLGDVDSGPLIAGVSLSATAVMLGTARVNGDDALAHALWRSAETVGLPTGSLDNRYYLAAEPFAIGNVFAAWSASSGNWVTQVDPAASLDLPVSWRWQIHAWSTVTLVLLSFPLRRLSRRRRRAD